MRFIVVATVAMVLATVGCGSPRAEHDTPATESVTAASAAESLLHAGEALHEAGEFDSARAVLNRARSVAHEAGDERTGALVLTRLGLAAWRLGDIESARASQDSALALKLHLGMTDELWRSYNALGLIALSENRNREAAALFEQAAAAATAAGDHAGVARATGNAALAFGYLGDLRRARAGHRTMRTAGRALEDKRVEGNGLANEAMIDIAEGDPESAIVRLDTARALYREISYALGEQNALGQLATALEMTGDYGRTFALLDSALVVARGSGVPEQEIEILRLLGGVHLRVGDHRRAVRYYEQAEATAKGAGLLADLGSVHRGTAQAHLLLGNLPGARSKAMRALELHDAAEEPLDQLDDLLLLASIEGQAGDSMAAMTQLTRAGALAESMGTRGPLAAVTLARAHEADRTGDAPAVLRALATLEPAVRTLDFEVRWSSAALASRAYARLNLLDSAVASGRDAVDALERTRGTLSLEPMRNTYVAERAAVYGELVLTLLRLGRPDEAFEVADRARSRGLVEHLASARAGGGREAVPRELAEAEVLLRRIDALVEALRQTEPQRARLRGELARDNDPLEADLASARTEYEALLVRANRRSPRATAIVGAGRPSLPAVAAVLAKDEALIEYFLTAGKLVAFVVRNDAFTALQLDLDHMHLAERARLLRDVWGRARGDWQVGLPASDALYRALISPARESGRLNGVRTIVIVPHGMLAQVPFPALHDSRSGRFLAQDAAIIHAPSAAAFAALRARGTGQRESAGGAQAFAPLPRRLPATAGEVRAFTRAVPGATGVVGSRASEKALRTALESGAMVHVATHGVLNRHHPMFSRIELARPRLATATDDGRLEVRELLSLNVRSPLVFMSGCETGAAEGWLAEPVRGSGDLTLSHALLSAGARNVVSTLWRIEDAGAGAFAAHFYRHLKGRSAAEALSLSQREMIRNAQYSNPYYWAGYVLSGEGTAGIPTARTVAASVR